MHNAKMVRDVVTGLQEVLHQYKSTTDNTTMFTEPVNHVANVVQRTRKWLATRLQQM